MISFQLCLILFPGKESLNVAHNQGQGFTEGFRTSGSEFTGGAILEAAYHIREIFLLCFIALLLCLGLDSL